MRHLYRCGVLTAVVVLAGSFAVAQVPITDWVDGCEATAPDLQALLENEALIVDTTRLLGNWDGTYRLVHSPFDAVPGTGAPLCPNALFYGQARVTPPSLFRSAVQVGPDLILTAWHGAFAMDPGHRVVFGVHDRQIGDTCLAADFDQIPAAHVFTIVAKVADGYSHDGNLDYVLLKLDRMVDLDYPRVRRSGRWIAGESATLIGHPERMAAKVDRAGVMGGTGVLDGREAPLFGNVHVLDGSSGSLTYNRSQRMLETVVQTGAGAVFLPDTGQDGCFGLFQQPIGPFHTNASVRYFAEHIPAFELIVDSLNPVVHVGADGDSISNTSTSRTVRAPSTASAPIAYQIVPPAPSGPGQPSLTLNTFVPHVGTVAPGSSFLIGQAASAAGVPCGVYERSYAVRDVTHGFEDVARHVFEIGVLGIQVTGGPPGNGISDIAAPFEDTVTYVVTNPRPSEVTFRVDANQPWVTLNGQTSLTHTLAPAHQFVVTVGFNSGLASAGFGTHQVAITFAVVSETTCPTSPPNVQTFRFSYGRESFRYPAVVGIPNGSSAGIQLNLNVPETFCIQDVNVQLRTTQVPGPQLFFKLVSPAVSRRVLWDHGTLFDVPVGFSVLLDDQAPPHPVQPLSVLNGEQGGGTWHLLVVDDVPAVEGSLTEWRLDLVACGAPW